MTTENQITAKSLANRLADLAEGKWNPYYLAYAIETGASDPKAAFDRDGSNYRFMSWNNSQWDKTCKAKNINREYCSSFVDEHLETLAALPKVSAYLEAA